MALAHTPNDDGAGAACRFGFALAHNTERHWQRQSIAIRLSGGYPWAEHRKFVMDPYLDRGALNPGFRYPLAQPGSNGCSVKSLILIPA